MPEIAQSYDVNIVIKMFSHFCQICINGELIACPNLD
jgi:hypothetical protein